MAIENVMMETDQVENFAVCCTANLTIEAVNLFFAKVLQQEQEEAATPLLTLVNNLETRLWGPTKELRSDDTDTLLRSPFAGSDFSRIQQSLQQMKRTTRSPLNTEWFLVLDEQSEETSTAVIVNIEDGNARSVRVVYPVASRLLNTYDKIKQGSYVDVTLTMSAGHEGQQPAYIDLQQIGDDKGKGDRICLAVVSTTWKDGKQYAWVGDWAKACNVQFWYPSNIYNDNEGHKTACVWLDHDHSDAVPWSALKVHLPDFATKTKHELDWYCKKHPSVIQFHNQGDALYHWNVDKNRELANHTQISDVAAKPWASEPDQAKTKRSLSMKRSAVMSSQLVVSKGVQHSAKELCESDTSHGPDFVSEPERLFCDMGTKTLWLLCEGDEDQKPYFDHEAKQLRGVGIVGRDVEGFEYSRVTEWE